MTEYDTILNLRLGKIRRYKSTIEILVVPLANLYSSCAAHSHCTDPSQYGPLLQHWSDSYLISQYALASVDQLRVQAHTMVDLY